MNDRRSATMEVAHSETDAVDQFQFLLPFHRVTGEVAVHRAVLHVLQHEAVVAFLEHQRHERQNVRMIEFRMNFCFSFQLDPEKISSDGWFSGVG